MAHIPQLAASSVLWYYVKCSDHGPGCRHGKLVAGAPLRLRTGLLLYGPPGCGKTHIVGAAVAALARELNIRFISVKVRLAIERKVYLQLVTPAESWGVSSWSCSNWSQLDQLGTPKDAQDSAVEETA